MRIIPAIDLLNGNAVRLQQGKYEQNTIYYKNPLDMAKMLHDHGFQYLHLVDLNGAKERKVIHHKILENIVSNTNLKVDFGGGIANHEELQKVLEHGANQVNIGSLAVKQPEIVQKWIQELGNDTLIIGADFKTENEKHFIATSGWTSTSEKTLEDFVEDYLNHQAKYFVITDISKDGMLQGSNREVYQKLMKQFPDINLIASGGVTTLQEIEQLQSIGCEGVIVGKALYENKISIKELASLC